MASALATELERPALVRRGRVLSIVTLLYNSLEGIIAVIAGFAAGSVALVGFGVDSGIEVSASAVALWRLAADTDVARRARAERLGYRLIGVLFFALAAYVAADATASLIGRDEPEASPLGIALAALSLVVMPYLASNKRRVGVALGSLALTAESRQTSLCMYLSAILLCGLVLNAALGWWWADPVAALLMVPIIVREGIEGVRGEPPCADACH